MKLLTVEDLLYVHSFLINETGGSGGVRDVGRLEAVVASQTQSVFGEELYPNVVYKSAAVIRGIIQDHPFVDGNIRSGMLCGITLIHWNEAEFKSKPREIEDFAVKVATNNLSVTEIANWLKVHSD